MNSISLIKCISNAAYNTNTLQDDAILITGNNNQRIHISTNINNNENSLVTLDESTMQINGDCIIFGSVNTCNPISSQSLTTGSIFIGNNGNNVTNNNINGNNIILINVEMNKPDIYSRF